MLALSIFNLQSTIFNLALLVSVSAAAADAPPRLALKPILKGMQRPVQIVSDGSDRLFIVEQVGTIRVYRNGALEPRRWLDLSRKIHLDYECGLLGLAFHPDYTKNGLIYLNYTAMFPGPATAPATRPQQVLRTVIAELRTDPKTDLPDPASERVVLAIDQPFPNHKAGHLEFGADGMLYIGTGDGGDGNDPLNHGQRLDSLLGKMLRIDVTPREEYAVPRDNPFVGREGVRPEIWAYGIRNPWRYGFDKATGLLYLADVGQDKWEEVNVIEKGGNYGWRIREGAFDLHPVPNPPKMIDPIHQYQHEDNAASITGGLVYRGKAIPALQGWYFFGDYVHGKYWAIRYDPEQKRVVDSGLVIEGDQAAPRGGPIYRRPTQPSCIGADADGELYVGDINGWIFRVVPEPPAAVP